MKNPLNRMQRLEYLAPTQVDMAIVQSFYAHNPDEFLLNATPQELTVMAAMCYQEYKNTSDEALLSSALDHLRLADVCNNKIDFTKNSPEQATVLQFSDYMRA